MAANSRQLEFRVPIFALTCGNGEPSMKMHWCWRCKADVPMLDDDEWRRLSSLFHTGSEGNSKERMYAPALRKYERITG